jgi:hypothetical protein
VHLTCLQTIPKPNIFNIWHVLYWLIDHFYSAHIHSIECPWHLADILGCSQVSPVARLKIIISSNVCVFDIVFASLNL